MPLPLPNLDTRRWSDMVDEARGLIPRYARGWTSHNIADSGIAVVEMLAWQVEQEIYRANRVPLRHRRKLLALTGVTPRPPRAATVPLTFPREAFAPGRVIPAGSLVAFGDGVAPIRYRTQVDLDVSGVTLRSIQTGDDGPTRDLTRDWREGTPFLALGDDPRAAPGDPAGGSALYLGFDADPSPAPLSLWLRFASQGAGRAERERLPTNTTHHGARLAWEYYDGDWRRLPDGPAGVQDGTRVFTLDGPVRLALPGPPTPVALGADPTPRWYLRARLVGGALDAAPRLLDVAVDTVEAVQSVPAWGTFTMAPGSAPDLAPVVGVRQPIRLALDADGVVTALAAGDDVDGPSVDVLAYEAPTPAAAGRLVVSLVPVGRIDGSPTLQLALPDASVDGGILDVWTSEGDRMMRWRVRPDLDGSGRSDADVVVDFEDGSLTFGTGERGRMGAPGSWVLAAYAATLGDGGALAAGVRGRLDRRRTGLAEATAGEADVRAAGPSSGGEASETLASAFGRATATLWAHERLLGALVGGATTLDQLDRSGVLALTAPARAVTLADYERLALDVPGAVVRRARAWAGLDPHYPGLRAPGTVTVVVVPELPRGRPSPGAGLLRAVAAYLDRQRIIGTRLVVVGPRYVTVTVEATVRARPGADPEAVRARIVAALDAFLNPLTGGPDGRGWPFGRDVYRGEALQAVHRVPGVDHVVTLTMTRQSEDEPAEAGAVGGASVTDFAACGNLGIGPTELTTPGPHTVTVVRP